MIEHTDLLIAFFMFIGAALYTSVGHAGASAYIAIMALFSVPFSTMKPTALFLNIIVSMFASWRYIRVGYFNLRTLYPILIGAIPMSFIGGYIQLPGAIYRPLVGIFLIISAVKFFFEKKITADQEIKYPPIISGVIVGAGIGLLAGLTGTGGGIFLSPIILFLGWSDTKTASGIAAVFIFFNSLGGLLGNISSVNALPHSLPILSVAVILGAIVGTFLGIKYLGTPTIRKVLGVVLLIAGIKMISVTN